MIPSKLWPLAEVYGRSAHSGDAQEASARTSEV
jgi:hypothetical protein